MPGKAKRKRGITAERHQKMKCIIKDMTMEGAPFKQIQDKLLEVLGDKAPAASTIRHWRKCYAFELKNTHGGGGGTDWRTNDVNSPYTVNLVKQLVQANNELPHEIIGEIVGISPLNVLRIMCRSLQLKKCDGRWVSCGSTKEMQTSPRLTVSEVLLNAGIKLAVDCNSKLYPYIVNSPKRTPTLVKEEIEESHSTGDLVISEVFTLSHPDEIQQKLDSLCRLGPITRESTYPRDDFQDTEAKNGSVTDFSEENDENDDNLMEAQHLSTYKEALTYLGPLEQFALFKENLRVIGLINQIENIFRGEIDEGHS